MHLVLTFVYCNKRYYNEINKTMYLVVTSISISMSISIFIYYIYYKSWISKTKGCKLRWQCLFLKLHNNYMCQHIYLLSFEFKFRRKKNPSQIHTTLRINWNSKLIPTLTPRLYTKSSVWEREFMIYSKIFRKSKKKKKRKNIHWSKPFKIKRENFNLCFVSLSHSRRGRVDTCVIATGHSP